MRLQSKLALFNTLSRAILIIIFLLILPIIIKKISLENTNEHLRQGKEKVLSIIRKEGINNFIKEGEVGYGSYNLLKEEFISLEEVESGYKIHNIENTKRKVENEIVQYRVLSHTFSINNKTYLLEFGKSISTIADINKPLTKFGFYVLVLVLLVTVIFDILYTRFLLKPLNTIIHRKLREVKNPSGFRFEQIKTSTEDFKYLDESINEMMRKIQDAFQKEREFIGNVSHELLTPVSILQNKLENILDGEKLPEQTEVKIIESQKTLTRLKNIIKALLLISKIENEQFLRNESVIVKDLVLEVLEEIQDRLSIKNITLLNELKENYVYTNANKPLLFTMIFNFLNNAIKYNQKNGKIILKDFLKNGKYELLIIDTGIGIEPENIGNIFNRFKRFTSHDKESYGLGLPIVKTVADFHEIEIEVASKPGEGAEFKIIF